MSFIVSPLKLIVFAALAITSVATHAAQGQSLKPDSIEHYRAFSPPLVSLSADTSIITEIAQSKDGYLWVAGNRDALLRYDGYELQKFALDSLASNGEIETFTTYVDAEFSLWAATNLLHLYDDLKGTFTSFDVVDSHYINDMTDDHNGNLWLVGEEFGFGKFNKQTKTLGLHYTRDSFENMPDVISSVNYDHASKALWLVATQGIYRYSIDDNTLIQVATDIDLVFDSFFRRQVSLDAVNRHLWVPTTMGLLRVHIDTQQSYLYNHDNSHQTLPMHHITTTLLDRSGRLWLGLEKNGLCVYRLQTNDFSCMGASDDKENAIPLATIEHIFEDQKGTLWLAMNNSGFVRVSPNLEKFTSIELQLKNNTQAYYKRTMDGLVHSNGKIWLASDGGGVQIFDPQTGDLTILKSDQNDPNALRSDAIIDIEEGPQGNVWVGTWGGGMSKINPTTFAMTHFSYDLNSTENKGVLGNEIVELEFDQQGGLWLHAWYRGLQYFDLQTQSFTNYIHGSALDDYKSFRVDKVDAYKNKEVNELVLRGDNLWMIGPFGLERFSISASQSDIVFTPQNCPCETFTFSSRGDIYIGASQGFYIYDPANSKAEFVALPQSLLSVRYFQEDQFGRMWIATNVGIVMYDPKTNNKQLFDKDDGVVSNNLTRFGRAFTANGELYFPSRAGVTIVDPSNLPLFDTSVATYIGHIKSLNDANPREAGIDFNRFLATARTNTDKQTLVLPFDFNSLAFNFSTFDYIYPQQNKFKYRLLGLNTEFEYVGANERVARFTNLPAGQYTFEVFAGNSHDIWDPKGANLSFTILPPWYMTWWAYVLYFLCLSVIYFIMVRWRLHVSKLREQNLAVTVKEKTQEISRFAEKLKATSDELAALNMGLEKRVEERTNELKVEINERKVIESKLYHMAFHDALTGLPNREWLVKKLDDLMRFSHRETFGLMFLDGDRFKAVNDTHGHSVGDELLIAGSERLSKLLNEKQYAARLGGDEFTVIAQGIGNAKELEALAARVVNAFKEPFELNSTSVYLNMSIGVVLCDLQYKSVSGLLRDADIAMYQAKDKGKANYQLFTSDMRSLAVELFELESELRLALKRKQFHLVYQPLIDLKDDCVSGFEALIRWQHPEKGNIPPDVFIGIAEDTGLITQIGEWVLREACNTLSEWQLLGDCGTLSMSVNLSSIQLSSGNFIRVLDEVLEASNIDGEHLKLELTETSLIQDNESVATMLQAIRERNVELAIDDFGTGYSSLSYLTQLPVQHIKIDRKFVDAIDKGSDQSIDDEALNIVSAAITLGKSVNMKVTAEGIETTTELNKLKELDCDYGQGYLFARPMPAKEAFEDSSHQSNTPFNHV